MEKKEDMFKKEKKIGLSYFQFSWLFQIWKI